MGYSVAFRVGMEDLRRNGKIKNRSLLRFCEDAAGFHSASVGDGLLDRQFSDEQWVLMGWRLQVRVRPAYGQTVCVETCSTGMERASAFRDFFLRAEDGSVLAQARSQWCLMNMERRALVRIPNYLDGLYGREAGTGTGFPRLTVPQGVWKAAGGFTVFPCDTDYLGHMHNLRYYDLAEAALTETAFGETGPERLQIRYFKEMAAGDSAERSVCELNGRYYVKIQSEKGLHALICME